MNTTQLCQRLLGTDQLFIHQVEVEAGRIRLKVSSKHSTFGCPACGWVSDKMHSQYVRHPVDLAWADYQVVLELHVKRFFCHNAGCSKRTFAERFPDLVASYARRTARVLERQRQIALPLCARAAEKLFHLFHFGMSDTSINRLLRDLPEPEFSKLRVVGVDDWAKRKGQRYGTILVDLEQRQIVDLLEDQTCQTLSEWLAEHEGIEVVSRDRSKTYAKAISEGAPDAVQVADRWHLLKNLSDTVCKLFQSESTLIKARMKRRNRQI
ncbi:MAG: ISL3 family transposase [Deltaproteobacteria bacterium]|nr:ISL3 family transposase [Deltaproteobacteria bacterium]